jgi:hypothetical protein
VKKQVVLVPSLREWRHGPHVSEARFKKATIVEDTRLDPRTFYICTEEAWRAGQGQRP